MLWILARPRPRPQLTVTFGFALALAGCQGDLGGSGDDAGDDGPGEAGTPDLGGSGGDTGDERGGDDDGAQGAACDAVVQDCPEDFKCTLMQPEANLWAFQCVPVRGDDPAGSACVHDGLRQGTDSCDARSYCFGEIDLAGDIGWEGRCYALCDYADPGSCAPNERCASASGVPLCAVECNPLLTGECASGEVCIYRGDTAGFVCFPAASERGDVGEICESALHCRDGLSCQARAPGCEGTNCCTPLCDLSASPDPCPDFHPAGTCVALPNPNPAQADIGVCLAE